MATSRSSRMMRCVPSSIIVESTRAHDLEHDLDVAINVLRAEILQAFGAERFRRELRMSAKLGNISLAFYCSSWTCTS